jgi:hypothetical protein
MKQELGNLMAEDPQQETINLLTYRLNAVTEQRDELMRYNEAFRKETLICADCDAISKKEYDQAIEQRDRLAGEIKEVTNQKNEALAQELIHLDNYLSMKEQRNMLVEALKDYKLNYTDEDLARLATCETGMGEICPAQANREIRRREALAAVEGGSDEPVTLIHNGVGIADMYSRDEFENAMKRTNQTSVSDEEVKQNTKNLS